MDLTKQKLGTNVSKEQIEMLRKKQKAKVSKPMLLKELDSAYKDEKTVDGMLKLLGEREVQVSEDRVKRYIEDRKAKAKQLQQDLTKVYYDKNMSTNSIRKLYDAAKSKGISVTLEQVKAFIEDQDAYQTNKQVKRPKFFNSIIAPRPGSNLQIDLMELKTRYKMNKTPYLLNVVDIHSRRAWSVPLANKESETVTKAMSGIIDEITRETKRIRDIPAKLKVAIVKSINGDAGGEFESKVFRDMLKEKGTKYGFPITMYTSDPKDYAKNGIVERFNRTLRTLMREARAQDNYRRLNREDLKRLIDNYNKERHSTIKAKPIDVWELKDKNKQKYNFIQFKYKKGDRVRTLNKNALFEKGTYEYSEELYTIDRVDGKRFYLVDKDGDQLGKGYLGYELMLVKNVLKNPDYDVFLTKANKELELQDL
eukprot:SAG31_NODE_7494_length_1674_cov_1.495873_2_plen_423_part_01